MQVEVTNLVVSGAGQGEVLATEVPLSFWGGVDPATGEVIDQHHPLVGQCLSGRVLVMPHGRGSCTGSLALLEAIHAGVAPALILLNRADEIISLGAIVAEEVLQHSVPVVVLGDEAFDFAGQAEHVRLDTDGHLLLTGAALAGLPDIGKCAAKPRSELELGALDRQRLAGEQGVALQVAMRIICRMAEVQGAARLVDITRAHIDGCIHTGPASVAFAEYLLEWGGQVSVPTTLNAISVDRRGWKSQGVPAALGEPAERLAQAYVDLGARPSYTCAPYLLDEVPGQGEFIAWAESNAVAYGNSVLGARTNKTPDLLDACIALTGRAPFVDYYLDSGRRGRVVIDVPRIEAPDDALYPLLGYVVGLRADRVVPVVTGLEQGLSPDALKAFGAAFATVSSAAMFHIAGVTPEAGTLEAALGGSAPDEHVQLTIEDLAAAWREFNGGEQQQVGLVALGNPHFSYAEIAAMAGLCEGRKKHADVAVVVTTSRHVAHRAEQAGHLKTLADFGARIMTDTCWCMVREPIVTASTTGVVTNSAKYAHYGPGLIGQNVHFASLEQCIEMAECGRCRNELPAWLVSAKAG